MNRRPEPIRPGLLTVLAMAVAVAVGGCVPAPRITVAPTAPGESLALRYTFDDAVPGRVPNRAGPGAGTGGLHYVSRSVYGSWRGGEVWPDDERVYPRLVLGRDGRLSALRTGTAGETISPTGWLPDFEAGYTISAWLWVYDHGDDFGGAVFNLGSGYKQGWRLEFTKAHWVKEGRLSLVCGTATGSTGIEGRPFPPETWHHVVLVAGNGQMSLYVNGGLAGQTDEPLVMPAPGESGEWLEQAHGNKGFRICGKWYSKAGLLDYRLDELAGIRRALTADEIKTLYEAGKPAKPDADLSAREASLNALRLEIPKDTWGYFPAGQSIPLTFSAPVGAALPQRAALRLADSAGNVILDEQIDFASALPATIKEAIAVEAPGLYRLSMRLLDDRGRTLKETVYPLGITDGALPQTSAEWLGAANMALHPEPLALGVGLNRVVCDWGEVEPAKGEYDWTTLDFMVLAPRNHGLDLLVCLTGMPAWLGGDPNAEFDARGATAYRTIWRKLLARYPQVQFWEVGNMPDRPPGNWRVRVPRYRQQLEIAAAEIRQRGKRVLGGGSWDASLEWTEAVLADAGGVNVDILTIQTPVAKSAGGELAARLQKIRAACVAAGRPDLAIWNTGLGGQTADALVASIETQRTVGVERLVIAPGIIDGDPSREGLAVIGLHTNKQDRAEK